MFGIRSVREDSINFIINPDHQIEDFGSSDGAGRRHLIPDSPVNIAHRNQQR